MGLTLPNDIVNDTTADAVPVEQNYSVIEQYINSELINRDGSVGMSAPLLLVGAPTQDLHAATKAYVDAILPVGTVLIFLGAAAPAGDWALANGASLAISGYPDLYAVLGYRYGGSGGSFLLPNLAGRVPVGVDTTQTHFNTTGKTGGSSVVPIPKHHHGIGHNHPPTNSGKENTEHYHSMAHNHPSVLSTNAGAHGHVATTARRTSGPGTTESVMPAGTTGQSDTSTSSVLITSAPNHQHTVDLGNFVGNTGGRSATHDHPVDILAFAGDSADTGVDNATLVQPFVVVSYIVRVR